MATKKIPDSQGTDNCLFSPYLVDKAQEYIKEKEAKKLPPDSLSFSLLDEYLATQDPKDFIEAINKNNDLLVMPH